VIATPHNFESFGFESLGLHPIIVRNLELMGYHSPRAIQAQVIPAILAGRDVIGLAEAGSGKTAAFAVPLAHRLISAKPAQTKGRPINPVSRLRALALCPTRELAQQVADEAGAIMQGSVLRVACAYGKVAISPQAQAIARGVDLLVATPGRVRELLESGALSLAYIKHIVIDEADRMLDMGFLPQVRAILQAIPNVTQSNRDGVVKGSGRQTLLFTATLPREIEELSAQFLNDPARIEIGRHTTPVQHVAQHLLPGSDDDKVAMLLHLIEQKKRRGVMVFCRTRRRVGWVGTALERNGISVGMLHGERSQAQRQRALDRFANDELRVMVATDVAARGLHIPGVKTVVNYDVAMTPEEHVHRIGRAGHGSGATGEAYTFLTPDDRDRRHWRAILDVTATPIYAEELEGFKPAAPVKRRSAPARDSGDAEPNRQTENRPAKRRPKTSKQKKPTSRKSRPIKPGQKPGKGVVRRET
jgi:ATP-dependent RNA helicase RhlE